MIASFRLLPIVQVTIVFPHHWLAINTHLLYENDSGITDMEEVANLIHAMKLIALDGKLILIQYFMVGILRPIQDTIERFKEYV